MTQPSAVGLCWEALILEVVGPSSSGARKTGCIVFRDFRTGNKMKPEVSLLFMVTIQRQFCFILFLNFLYFERVRV